jgi:aminoglycoside phosphotransferase (APT) family kinase protein
MTAENAGPQLRAILTALREEIKPELSSPQVKFRAELIDAMLSRLAAQADGGDAGAFYWPELGDNISGQEFSDRMSDSADPRLIAHIAAAERTRRVALEDAVAENMRAIPAGHSSAGELAIAPETVTQYLRARFPDDPGITATRVSVVPGGRSKATILLEFSSAKGPRDIVIRKDFELGVAGISVADEYPVIRAAFDAGLPVPEPLWLEAEKNVIGGRFIAFAKVRGTSQGNLFQSNALPGLVREFAATLAKLHAIDLEKSGLIEHLRWAREPHPVRALIDHFYGRYRKLPPNPLMDVAFAWARLKIADIGNARALVHGDAALHNVMGEGDHLTALLDWEFAHAGDPAEDLAYCKFLCERILPWDAFMDIYVAAGGERVSEARIQFFSLWRTLHIAVHAAGAKEEFDSGADRDLRKAAIGYNTFPKQLRDLAVDLARFTQ